MQARDGPGNRTYRVVVADDHALIRRAICSLLDARNDVEVVGQAANGKEAIDAVGRSLPDVVLMDVSMPELSGVEATRQIRSRYPGVKVLMLSAHGDAARVGQSMAAGASDFIIKRSDVDELVLALQLVTTGNMYFSRDLTERMDVAEVTFNARNQVAGPRDLTDREREVLQLIAEGHTLKEIAELLVISPKTVDGHNTRIMAKVGAKNRADLVRYAIMSGIVHGVFEDDI